MTAGLWRRVVDEMRLPRRVRRLRADDRAGRLEADPGADAALEALRDWLGRAQDEAPDGAGGLSSGFSLIDGWAPADPQVTGYVVPTLLMLGEMERVQRAVDWLVATQQPDGGFDGPADGNGFSPSFGMGRILLGLSAVQRAIGGVDDALRQAGTYLLRRQEESGAWRTTPSALIAYGQRAHDALAAFGLFEAERVMPDRGFGDAGLRNVRWSLKTLRQNGWNESLRQGSEPPPLSLGIGYALRGAVEAYRYTSDIRYLDAALLTGWALVAVQRPDGALPGRLNERWQPVASWTCLAGNAEIASCWLLLHGETGEPAFLKAARAANAHLRRTVVSGHGTDCAGAVRGSFPIDGDFAPYTCLAIAARAAIEANRLEKAAVNAG